MPGHTMSCYAPAIPLLVCGIAWLAIGLSSDTETFLWMAPGFIATGVVLLLMGRRRARRSVQRGRA